MAKVNEETGALVPEVLTDYSTFGLPQVSDPFERLQILDRVNAVETWDFENEGPTIAGLRVSCTDRYHEKFGRYPYIVLQLQDGSMRGVACVGMLLEQMADRGQDGDLIRITQGEKKFNRVGDLEYNNHVISILPKGTHDVGVQPEKAF